MRAALAKHKKPQQVDALAWRFGTKVQAKRYRLILCVTFLRL